MTLLCVRNLAVSFGGVRALRGIDLEISKGAIWGLMGPNGAGKTTFVNLLSGLIRASSGTMSFDGVSGGPWPITRAVSMGIVRTFQQTRAFQELTIRENLLMAEMAAATPPDIDTLIDLFDLRPVLDRTPAEMPYPVLRRLGIALALACSPKLLLLDEPAVGLTADELRRMADIIVEWNRRGVTILLIEHNVRFLMSLAHRVAVFDQGRKLFEGTPGECRANAGVIDVYLGRRHEDA